MNGRLYTKALIELRFIQDVNKSKDAELTQFKYVNILGKQLCQHSLSPSFTDPS